MRIGLLGGTFDPIHNGHIALAEAARRAMRLDEIWLLPAGTPYFKKGRDVSPAADRLAMTRRAAAGLARTRVCEIEIRRNGDTYTYETIKELNRLYPADSFFFIFGADCLEKLPDWRFPERILAGAEIIAAARGELNDRILLQEKADRLSESLGGKITVIDFPPVDISSSMIREKVRLREKADEYVPRPVASYIRRQGLYLNKESCGGERKSAEQFSPLRGVILDMDGTLLDTERLFIDLWKQADGRESPELDEALHDIIGVTRERAREIVLEKLGGDYPYEACRRFVDDAFRKIREEGALPVKAGAEELLRFLREEGFKTALASSTIRELVIPEMQAAGLSDYFDIIIAGDDVKNGKPAPDIFLEAAAGLRLRPEECLAIEDSFNGIRAAHLAGMRPVMVPDIKKPDDEISRLAEVICKDLDSVREWIARRECDPV